MDPDFPCVECPVFAMCNSRGTDHLLGCGQLMRYILEDVSDRAGVGIRVELAGEVFKREFKFDIEEMYFTVDSGLREDESESREFFLLLEKGKDGKTTSYMIHDQVSIN